MTEINLLPWRELKREREKRLFTTLLLVGLVAAVIIVFLINYYAKSLVNNQMFRNQRLKNEITLLDKKIEEIEALKKVREALISRMLIVQNLQSTRILTVHLFDELVKVVPEGVFITKLERKDNLVTAWGFTQSASNISDLMRNIEKNAWIQNPSLTEIKKADKAEETQDNEFRLNFVLGSENQSDGAINQSDGTI